MRSSARKRLTGRHSVVNPVPQQGVSGEGAAFDVDRLVPDRRTCSRGFWRQQRASHWLANPLPLLDNRSPVQILMGGGDFDAVDRILTPYRARYPVLNVQTDIPSLPRLLTHVWTVKAPSEVEAAGTQRENRSCTWLRPSRSLCWRILCTWRRKTSRLACRSHGDCARRNRCDEGGRFGGAVR